MRTRLIVEADVLRHEATELLFADDQDVIEQLATERAREALGERVHVRGSGRGAHAEPDRLEHGREAPSELCVAIADEHLRTLSSVAFRACGAPRIRGRVRHRGVHDVRRRRSRKNSTKTSRNRTS